MPDGHSNESVAPIATLADLPRRVGAQVTLRGWLQGKRSGGKVVFLLVRDGTGVCQCVVEAARGEAFKRACDIGQESSLSLQGTVRSDARSPGGVELAVESLSVLQAAEDYPIARKEHGVDFLMQHRHLWLRSPRQVAILRVRHTLIRAARRFFDDRGFTLVDTPIFSPGAAEGAGTLFSVDYFGETVSLAQTGQLYLEAACMALGKVYCFGPTFRAEKSKTRRHLTEFWMIEPEIAFAELPDLMDLAEAFIVALVRSVLDERAEDLATIGRDPDPLRAVLGGAFPRITYTKAVDLLRAPETQARIAEDLERERERLETDRARIQALEKEIQMISKGWKQDRLARELQALREDTRERAVDLEHRMERARSAAAFAWGDDLGGDEETVLSKLFDRPLIVTEYPRSVKAFYMKPSPVRPDCVLNMDVLAPEGYGEIIGGSRREDRLDALEARMREEGMTPEPYRWYLDLRRYGSVPHGGFGLGIERTVAWLCGLRHIRETIPFPRLMGRIYP